MSHSRIFERGDTHHFEVSVYSSQEADVFAPKEKMASGGPSQDGTG